MFAICYLLVMVFYDFYSKCFLTCISYYYYYPTVACHLLLLFYIIHKIWHIGLSSFKQFDLNLHMFMVHFWAIIAHEIYKPKPFPPNFFFSVSHSSVRLKILCQFLLHPISNNYNKIIVAITCYTLNLVMAKISYNQPFFSILKWQVATGCKKKRRKKWLILF